MPPRSPDRAAPRAIALVTLVTLVGSLLAPAGPAAAADDSYVALGDSYSSGTGTRTYVHDGTACLRSPRAYPSLLAAQRGYSLNLRACSGATIADVTRAQLGALSGATSSVTISVGGNDAGFARVLTACATPWWLRNCTRAVDRAEDFIDDTLPGRLATLYARIRTRAPGARVAVVGYPRIFGRRDCDALTFFSPRELDRLNVATDLINRRIRQAAAARGFAFANPTRRFAGHAVCAETAWIRGLSFPVVESYHPNRRGHARGYRRVVGALVPVGSRLREPRRGRIPAREIAQSQRRYAGVDAGIEPEPVRPPNLRSPRARRAAERAGVSIEWWIRRQQR